MQRQDGLDISPPAITGTTATPAAPDLAALADDIYERVERRLRADLLFERERTALLADPARRGSL